MRLAGVDGCRGGWVAAFREGARRYRSLGELFQAGFDLLIIDVPIGLPEGLRRCDAEARMILGRRRSSIFPAPPRTRLHDAAFRCSRQLFNILPKIREIDALMTRRLQRKVREGHPETSFALLAGSPLRWNKKTPEGQGARRALLAPRFGEIARVSGAAPDDVLDAYALLWSAQRLLRGEARILGDGKRDGRGLRCEIVA